MSDPIEAKVLAEINTKLKDKPGIILAYLVRIEDPELPKKIRYFIATKVQENSVIYIEMTGFEIPSKDKKLSFDKLEEYLEKNSIRQIKTKIPWNRIIEITKI